MLDPTGTIGSKPCEIKLNKLLADLNRPCLTKNVMSYYQKRTYKVKKLIEYCGHDIPFCLNLIRILRTDDLHTTDLPKTIEEPVYSLLRCCVVALYRNVIKEVSGR